jgi:hypothetical protein
MRVGYPSLNRFSTYVISLHIMHFSCSAAWGLCLDVGGQSNITSPGTSITIYACIPEIRGGAWGTKRRRKMLLPPSHGRAHRALHPLGIPKGLVLSPKLLDIELGANPRI